MPEGNPLVAQAPGDPDGPGPFTEGNGDYGWAGGIGIAESAMDTFNGIKDGNWIEGGLGMVGLAAEAANAAIDPFGWLMSSVASFLMEHIQPLKDMLDSVCGDPPVIRSYAETWGNVAKHLTDTEKNYTNSVKAAKSGWEGGAASAYQQHADEMTDALKGAASVAGSVSTVTMVFGEVVAFVRELVRDLIADLVGKLIAWVLETVFSLGFGTPVVVAQATVAIARWATKIADLLRRLTSTLRRVSPLLGKLADVIGKVAKVFAKVAGKVMGFNPRSDITPGFIQRPSRDGLNGPNGGPNTGNGPDGNGPDGDGPDGTNTGNGPGNGNPGGNNPSGNNPSGNNPGGNNPGGNNPSGNNPGGNDPGSGPNPTGAGPGTRSPGSNSPDGNSPSTSSPGSSSPGGNSPSGSPGPHTPSNATGGPTPHTPSPSSYSQSPAPHSPTTPDGGAPSPAASPGGTPNTAYNSPNTPPSGPTPSAGSPHTPTHSPDPGSPSGPTPSGNPSPAPSGAPHSPVAGPGPSATPSAGSPPHSPDASSPGGPGPSGNAPSPGGTPHSPGTPHTPDGTTTPGSTSPGSVATPTAHAPGTPHMPAQRTDSPNSPQPPAGTPVGGMPGTPGGTPGGSPSPGATPGGRPPSGWTGTPGSPTPHTPSPSPAPHHRPGPNQHAPAAPHSPAAHTPGGYGPGAYSPTPHGPAGTPRQPVPRGFDPGSPGSPTRPGTPDGPRPPHNGPNQPGSNQPGSNQPGPNQPGPNGRHPHDPHSTDPHRHDPSHDPNRPDHDPHGQEPNRPDHDPNRSDHDPTSPDSTPDRDPLSPEQVNGRHAEPTPAGTSYHRGDPEMGDLPHRVQPDPDGRYTVDVHVTPDGHARIGGRDYTPEQFADILRRNGDYDGRPIRLIGCDAGSNDFAQRLSRELDTPVLAPDRPAWTDSNGRVFSSDYEIGPDGRVQPRIPPNGEWSVHNPDGTTTRAGEDGFTPDTPDSAKHDIDTESARARGDETPDDGPDWGDTPGPPDGRTPRDRIGDPRYIEENYWKYRDNPEEWRVKPSKAAGPHPPPPIDIVDGKPKLKSDAPPPERPGYEPPRHGDSYRYDRESGQSNGSADQQTAGTDTNGQRAPDADSQRTPNSDTNGQGTPDADSQRAPNSDADGRQTPEPTPDGRSPQESTPDNHQTTDASPDNQQTPESTSDSRDTAEPDQDPGSRSTPDPEDDGLARPQGWRDEDYATLDERATDRQNRIAEHDQQTAAEGSQEWKDSFTAANRAGESFGEAAGEHAVRDQVLREFNEHFPERNPTLRPDPDAPEGSQRFQVVADDGTVLGSITPHHSVAGRPGANNFDQIWEVDYGRGEPHYIVQETKGPGAGADSGASSRKLPGEHRRVGQGHPDYFEDVVNRELAKKDPVLAQKLLEAKQDGRLDYVKVRALVDDTTNPHSYGGYEHKPYKGYGYKRPFESDGGAQGEGTS